MRMRKTFKAGLSLFKIRVAEGLQYRMAALSGATISIFWGLIEIVVLTVFFTYGHNASYSVNGMTLTQVVSYTWVAQMMVGLMLMSAVDGDLMAKITSGDVGVELCRPLDLYWHWFARTAASKASIVGQRGLLVIVFAAALSLVGFESIGLGLPHSPLNFILFLTSFFGAFLFGASFGMLLTSIRMGISWGDGPVNVIFVFAGILSGGYLPLQIWPDFMQAFLRFQPFAASLDTPVRLYVGSISVADGLVSMSFQVIWIVVFAASGKIIMKSKIKNIVVQGG